MPDRPPSSQSSDTYSRDDAGLEPSPLKRLVADPKAWRDHYGVPYSGN